MRGCSHQSPGVAYWTGITIEKLDLFGPNGLTKSLVSNWPLQLPVGRSDQVLFSSAMNTRAGNCVYKEVESPDYNVGIARAKSVLDSLSYLELAFIAGVISLAYVVRGIAGFGSGLIAIPLLALILPLTTVVPLIVLLDYVASASHGLKHRVHIQWRELLPLLPFAILGLSVALFLFKSVDAGLLLDFLGIFILVYAIYSVFDPSSETLASKLWVIPSGGFGGLVGTLFGTGGPFYVLYLKHRGLTKTQFRATFATIFLIDGAARLVGYLISGFFQLDLLLMIALALPIMAMGLYFGGQVHTKMSQEAFQKGISVLLLFSGLSLLIK